MTKSTWSVAVETGWVDICDLVVSIASKYVGWTLVPPRIQKPLKKPKNEENENEFTYV